MYEPIEIKRSDNEINILKLLLFGSIMLKRFSNISTMYDLLYCYSNV